MPASAVTPKPLSVERSPWLRGSLPVPADAAAAHFALTAASLAIGRSRIEGAPESASMQGLAGALRGLGATVAHADGGWEVHGLGTGGLLEPEGPLELTGAPLAIPLLMGLTGACDFPTTLRGGVGYSRANAELAGLLKAAGMSVTGEPGRLPLTLHGPRLAVPLDLDLPPGLAAAKPALLLAALNARGTSRLREAVAGRPYAERLLAGLGAKVATGTGADGSQSVEIDGLADLRGRRMTLPGDPALAAVLAVAAAVVPGSELRIEGVLLDPARIAVLSGLVAMGGQVEMQGAREEAGERVADLVVRHTPLRANSFADRHVALLVDDLPLLAVAAAVADGDSVFHLPAEMALLQRARLTDLAAGLRGMGIEAALEGEMLAVRGSPSVPGGARIITDGDAGIGMAALVLGMAAAEPVTVDDRTGIEERFPGLLDSFERIGASFIAEDAP